MNKNKTLVILILISLGVACRLLPHAWNFTPIAAIALFSGVYLGKKEAILVPLLAMLAGDLIIGFYAFRIMAAVYFSLALAGVIGIAIKKHKSFETVLAGSIIASVLFFLATNLAVWYFSPIYSQTISGLIECYAMAIPFFRNTLLGNMFYAGVLFGVYEMALHYIIKPKTKNQRLKPVQTIN